MFLLVAVSQTRETHFSIVFQPRKVGGSLGKFYEAAPESGLLKLFIFFTETQTFILQIEFLMLWDYVDLLSLSTLLAQVQHTHWIALTNTWWVVLVMQRLLVAHNYSWISAQQLSTLGKCLDNNSKLLCKQQWLYKNWKYQNKVQVTHKRFSPIDLESSQPMDIVARLMKRLQDSLELTLFVSCFYSGRKTQRESTLN